MRLLTCSNSAPRLVSDDGVLKPSPDVPGGLVPIMAALLQEVSGHWIFTAPAESRGIEKDISCAPGESPWHPLLIDEGLVERQRESITIRTLLWLFHYLHDTSVQPSFDQNVQPAWQAYKQVNKIFSDALVSLHENANHEVVLVNDFHLMLAPQMFSDSAPKRKSILAYFHHVPWCEPDYFGILPEWMRTEILRSLLCCDFVGFHCQRWGDAFLACCDRFLPDAEVAERTIAYHDHETVVTTAPGPIDAHVLEEVRLQPGTEQWQNMFKRQASGRQVITRVDRLDLWKNLVRGFSAYEILLRRKPSLAADFWFCAIVTPPRLLTDRHKRYQALCEDAVKRINEQFTRNHEAVSLIYPDGRGSQRNRAVAALTVGSATLVNPTYDGLNIVAKEAVVVNPRAHLLLSMNAGAYPQLATCATAIQPFDVMSTADALGQAMEGRSTCQPDDIDTCLASLRRERPAKWLQAILGKTQLAYFYLLTETGPGRSLMDSQYQRPSVPSRLGIGPMSQNVVDAAIRLAYRHQRSVMVIASRSQVECEDFGNGYVERWSTEKFVDYIRSRDPAGLIKICRDHGGPWQHPSETSGNLDESQVMTHSLESLFSDIRSGVEILHIDTSREADGPATFERAADRLIELYGECQEFASTCAQKIEFEVGLEEQSSRPDDPGEFRAKLKHILEGLSRESLQPPTFVVGQTGTKVVGTENRGQLLYDPSAVGIEISQLAQICWEHGLALKAHNVDYLPGYAMRKLIQNGTDAVNIAPEFGVTETTAFLALLEKLQLTGPRDEFLRLAYNSGAWRKWFDGHDATDMQRSIAAGHYVFASDAFRDIKRQADYACRGQMKTVDAVLGAALDNAMEHYVPEIWNVGNKES